MSSLPSSFDNNTEFYEENRWQKLGRRLKEEPLVPFGCLLTVAALVGATRSIRAGDPNRTNRMFRARIYAQGFTLAAVVAGSLYWKQDREKRKEFEGLVSEKKAKEKNEKWIKELEARDEEDKMLKERRREMMGGGLKKTVDSVEKDFKEKERKVEEELQKKVRELEKRLEGVAGKIEDEFLDEEGKVVEKIEEVKSKGVLQSVQGLVWGSKK